MLEAQSTPGTLWLQGLGQLKNTMTSSGIEACIQQVVVIWEQLLVLMVYPRC
jgi:hypothetical protein